MSGATVSRYNSSYSFIDSKVTNSSGISSWTGVTPGTYNLEAYFNGEYWGNAVNASVTGGNTTNVTIQRYEPYAYSYRAYSGSTEVTGGTVETGTVLSHRVYVANDAPTSRTVRVRFRADRDQSSPYDFGDTVSSSQTIAGGGNATFLFSHTPSATGAYYSGKNK